MNADPRLWSSLTTTVGVASLRSRKHRAKPRVDVFPIGFARSPDVEQASISAPPSRTVPALLDVVPPAWRPTTWRARGSFRSLIRRFFMTTFGHARFVFVVAALAGVITRLPHAVAPADCPSTSTSPTAAPARWGARSAARGAPTCSPTPTTAAPAAMSAPRASRASAARALPPDVRRARPCATASASRSKTAP